MGQGKDINFTAEQKALIEKMAAVGCTQTQIADVIGCSHDALSDHAADLIKSGLGKTIARIAAKAIEAANNGDTDMQKFFLKAKAGWSETQKIEHTGMAAIVPIIEIKLKTPEQIDVDKLPEYGRGKRHKEQT